MPITLDDLDSPVLTDSQQSFTGGQFSNAVPIQIANNQCAALVNADIFATGQAQTRRGTAQLGGDVGSGTATRGVGFYRNGSSYYPIAISDTLLKYFNGSTWAAFSGSSQTFLGSTSAVIFAPGNGYVYVTDGTGSIRRADGTTTTALSTDSPPTAVNLLVYHTNRLMASGVSSAPDAIYFSGILDDTLWATLGGGYQIQIAGDGIPITALVPWSQTNLAVFKQNSTWVVGTDPLLDVSDMPVQQIHARIGCVAPRSAVQVGADIFFLSSDGVRTLQQTAASDNRYDLGQPLSFPIQDVMNRINPAQVSKAAAVYWKGKYILSFAADTSTTNNYIVVYDTMTSAWSGSWSNLPVGCFANRIDSSGIEKLMMGISSDNTVIEYLDYVLEPSATDSTYTDYNSNPVLLSILTRGFMFGDLQSMKKGINANVIFSRNRGDYTLQAIFDEGETTASTTIATGVLPGFAISFDIPFSIGRTGLQTASLDLMQYPEFYQVQFAITASSVGRKEVRQLTVQAFPEATDFRGNFSAT